MLSAYDVDEINGEERTVLRLHPRLAPYQVAVLPLSKKDTLTPLAGEVRKALAQRYMVDYDETQAIGRRYRRQDEIGTPLARHRRLRLARRQGRHDPRPRHHRAGPRADRQRRRARSPTGSASERYRHELRFARHAAGRPLTRCDRESSTRRTCDRIVDRHRNAAATTSALGT